MNPAKNLTVALTGASGSIFGQRLLQALERDARVEHVNFIASENSLRVLAEELQLSGRTELVAKLLGKPSTKIHQLAESNIGAGPASGSYPSDGMIILPCSMGTLAGIANGLAFGFTAYVILKIARGEFRSVSWLVYVLAALFIARFFYLGAG